VALPTIQGTVLAVQPECHQAVVEPFTQAVDPIVAAQAVLPERGAVRLNKSAFVGGVAARADCLVKCSQRLVMTLSAAKTATVDLLLVPLQRKTGDLMWKTGHVRSGQVAVAAQVFDVTVPAVQVPIRGLNRPVQLLDIACF